MSETLYGVVLLVVGLVLILCGVVVYVLTESSGVSWGLMGSGLAIVWLVAISWLRHVMKK